MQLVLDTEVSRGTNRLGDARRARVGQNSRKGGSRISEAASNALPGRTLATSNTPRMLEPFEIDILRQDLQAALKLLGVGEID
jgi:hypothetical protein